MIFLIVGYFRSDADPAPPELASALNEHLGTSTSGLRLAGYLRDATGRKIGFMGLFEADRFEQAESYLRDSPFYEARLYERAEALEFSIEVGALR
jgi:hypothetical protein